MLQPRRKPIIIDGRKLKSIINKKVEELRKVKIVGPIKPKRKSPPKNV